MSIPEETLSSIDRFERDREARKANGVYYTPSYIVDYIVRNTLGTLLERKGTGGNGGMRGLRILDPACGSGVFLLAAYQYLLDRHLEQYTIDYRGKQPHSRTPALCRNQRGQWQLTIAERRRILFDNIYGLDTDPRGVEATRLSLIRKLCEGDACPNPAERSEHSLPDLSGNIKCGNAIVGPEFCAGGRGNALEDGEGFRIMPFDWNSEFPAIMKSGGFDAVIGNPPWGGDIDSITNFIAENYPGSSRGCRDTFKTFIDRGLTLTRDGGLFGFVVPSAFMFQPRYIDIRRLVRNYHIKKLWNVGDKAFGPEVTAPCCVIVVEKNSPPNSSTVSVLDTVYIKDNLERAVIAQAPAYRKIPQSIYKKTVQEIFVTFYRPMRENEIRLEKILDCRDCGIKHQRIGVGLKQKGKTDLASRLYYRGTRQSDKDHRYLVGADLGRSGWHMDYSKERYFRADCNNLLHKNEIVYFNKDVFNLSQKIVWRQTSDRIRATIIGPKWFANTLQAGILRDRNYNLRYVLGLLNSRFLNFLYIESVKETGRVFPQVKLSKVRALPIRRIDFSNPDETAVHDRIAELADQLMLLHDKLVKADIEYDRRMIQRRINSIDEQINHLVCGLYDLPEEEIAFLKKTVSG